MSGYRVTYPGIKIISADMVHVHGVSPSACICKAILEQGQFVESGPLQFEEDDTINMVFHDCVVSEAYATPPSSSGVLHCDLTILDRRWKWKFKRVSGVYNSTTDSDDTDNEYAKTWMELFEIVLQALGEPTGSYSISVPSGADFAPAVQWDDYRADLALAELAEKAGCIVSLKLNNTIGIEPAGQGTTPNWENGLRTPETNFQVRQIPSRIRVQFAPTIYQQRMEFSCVVLDEGGKLVKIQEASWISDLNTFYDYVAPGVMPTAHKGIKTDTYNIANYYQNIDTLFRMYQAVNDVFFRITGGYVSTASSNIQMFPYLVSHQALGARHTPRWYNPSLSNVTSIYPIIDVESMDELTVTTHRRVLHPPDATFDHSSRLITLRDHAFKSGLSYPYPYPYTLTQNCHPAIVRATVAFTARLGKDKPMVRYEYVEDTSRSSSDDGEVTINYDSARLYDITGQMPGFGGRAWNNRTYLNEVVGPSVVEAYRAKWGGTMRTSLNEWSGIKVIEMGGTVNQVRWYADQHKVFTQCGKNLESRVLSPTHSARRLAEGLWHA